MYPSFRLANNVLPLKSPMNAFSHTVSSHYVAYMQRFSIEDLVSIINDVAVSLLAH